MQYKDCVFMNGKYTILASLCDWYQGASSKGVFEVSVEGRRRSFPLRFLWVVGLHHLVKMGDPWPSS